MKWPIFFSLFYLIIYLKVLSNKLFEKICNNIWEYHLNKYIYNSSNKMNHLTFTWFIKLNILIRKVTIWVWILFVFLSFKKIDKMNKMIHFVTPPISNYRKNEQNDSFCAPFDFGKKIKWIQIALFGSLFVNRWIKPNG